MEPKPKPRKVFEFLAPLCLLTFAMTFLADRFWYFSKYQVGIQPSAYWVPLGLKVLVPGLGLVLTLSGWAWVRLRQKR